MKAFQNDEWIYLNHEKDLDKLNGKEVDFIPDYDWEWSTLNEVNGREVFDKKLWAGIVNKIDYYNADNDKFSAYIKAMNYDIGDLSDAVLYSEKTYYGFFKYESDFVRHYLKENDGCILPDYVEIDWDATYDNLISNYIESDGYYFNFPT